MDNVAVLDSELIIDEGPKSKSLWRHAFDTLLKDKVAVISFIVVSIYALLAILTATGMLAADWAKEVGSSYSPPSAEHIFGTDIFGRSVLAKALVGTKIAMSIGIVTATISVVIGVFLGAIAGYFGGKTDEVIVWFYTTFSSVPDIMLLIAITLILGKGLFAVYLALGLTSWVTVCRLVRGEVIRHKDREYVQAASAIGGSHFRRLFIHILPNIGHIMIINFTLLFQTAIKSEVILAYLGLSVQDAPSWGKMIDDSKLELARGVWWQLVAATLFMFGIVLAFNLVGDAVRDALDPKLKGK